MNLAGNLFVRDLDLKLMAQYIHSKEMKNKIFTAENEMLFVSRIVSFIFQRVVLNPKSSAKVKKSLSKPIEDYYVIIELGIINKFSALCLNDVSELHTSAMNQEKTLFRRRISLMNSYLP